MPGGTCVSCGRGRGQVRSTGDLGRGSVLRDNPRGELQSGATRIQARDWVGQSRRPHPLAGGGPAVELARLRRSRGRAVRRLDRGPDPKCRRERPAPARRRGWSFRTAHTPTTLRAKLGAGSADRERRESDSRPDPPARYGSGHRDRPADRPGSCPAPCPPDRCGAPARTSSPVFRWTIGSRSHTARGCGPAARVNRCLSRCQGLYSLRVMVMSQSHGTFWSASISGMTFTRSATRSPRG